MNNNLRKLYNALQTIGMIDIDFEKFVQYMGKESYQQKVFQVISEEKLFDGDFNRFKSGYASQIDDSFYSNVTTDTVQESQEKNTWIENTFGKNTITDFFGDIYRSGAQGWAAGRSVDEALEIYKKGKDLTDEDLQAFLDANKRIQEAGAQDEMQEYLKIYEEAGGGAWGAIKGFAYNPSIFYTTIISSISQMLASAVDSEEVLGMAAASSGAGAGIGAGIGAAFGGIGAAPGAISGAVGGFFGGLTGAMETGNTLAQLLQEELGEGVEMTKENVRAILEDEQKFQSLKNKAVARGLTIGAIEGVTAGLSRGVGAKAFQKGLTGTTKRKLAATVTAGEMTAGAGGEFLGQKAAGQETEFSDIFLEGIAEAKGVMNIADILAKKSYTLNGGEASVADIESFFNDPNISDADKANADVKVEGDKKLQNFVDFSKIRANILSQIDTKVTDQKDRSKLVELEVKKAKAESDVKKKGAYAVPGAKKILEDINAEIEAILGKYEGAVGFGKSEAAIDARKKGFEKSKAKIEGEVEQAQKLGEDIKILSNEEFKKLTGLNPNAKVEGAAVNIKGVKYINLDVAAAARNIAVVTHEILHDSVDGAFANLDKVQQSKLLTDFFNMLDDTQFSYLKEALVAYDVQGNTINEVVLSLLEKGVATEVFTKFSDGIRENRIQYNETVFSKLKNVVEEILRQLSNLGVIPERLKILHRKEFSNARQVYNFLKDFNKTFDKKGRVSKRAKALSAKFPKTGVAFSKVEISKKAAEAQARVDAIGKKAATKAEYDAGINVEAYNYLIDEGNLDGLILSNLVRQGIDVQAQDANVNGVPLDNFIEDVKSKMIPEVLGFNPDRETTAQGKFGLSGYINQRLNYRIGDVSTKAKRTVTGRSIDKPIDDSGKTAAETVVAEKDVKTEAFEEQDLSIGAATRTEETQQESNELKSRYRHKLKNNDGTKLIGEEQVEDIRDGVRSALRNIAPETKSENFLLSYENKIKKTMKNIVQRSIGSGLKYQNFVLKNIEAIIDFSTVQDLVAMERLVGKGKLKDGKKIFTVPVKRLTKQEDIQKAIDQGKLPPDAIDKSAEGVFLSEKRMPTREELMAFFFGKDMLNVLGYEVGSSTLGTRKDGLSRMIVTELAQDATMETLQEPAVMEDILSSNVELHADVLVKDISNKIKRSPDLKFSKVLIDQTKDGRLLLDNYGFESNEFNNWINSSETLSEAKYRVINDFLNRQYENYRTVRKLVGIEKIDEVKNRYIYKNGVTPRLWKVFEIIGIEEVGKALKGVKGYKLEYTMPTEKGKALDISIITPDGKNIGIEVKGTTARGVATDINIAIKKGKATIKLAGDKVKEFFQDNANENNPLESFEKIEQEIVKATNELIEIINANPGLGKIETTAQGNLILTDKQRNSRKVVKKIKQLKSRLNKVKTYVSTQLIVDQYNKKGNQYINIGLSGLKRLGIENPLQLDESKVPNLADEKSQIRQTVRMRITSNGRIVFKVETQLDSRDFSKSEINLYNKNAAKQVFDASAITKNPKLVVAKNINKAGDNARNKSYSKVQKGASIFDFDETVGISENFVIAKKGKKTVRISSEDWPVLGEQYAEQGWSFDFTDFNRVTKGRPGPLMQKIKNQIKKYGPNNVFILTARAPQSEVAIHEWLKSQGVNIPLKNITGLGDSTGEAKAMWILDKYANEGYNDIYFVDDAMPNVDAVKNMLDQLDVKGKSVQARIQFSKSIASTLSKNKSYNKFKDSLAESVFYHGGLNSLKNKKAVWFIVDDVNGAELYADVRDVKDEVYSVKASQLKNSIIIPDINDSFGFDKIIKQKFSDQYEALVNSNGQVTIEKVLEADNAAEIISEYMSWADSKFELFEGVYGPEKGLYDSAGKIAKSLPVIVLNTDVSSKAKKVKSSGKFSKTSIRKDKSVQNVLDQLDIKGKSVQAKMSFSKTMKGEFNDILSRKGMDVDVDPARAKFLGKDIGRREFFIAPGADDFQGLMLRLAGKGDQGNKDVSFFKKAFFDPYNRAYRKLNQIQYNMMQAYSKIRKEHKDVIKNLKKKFDKQFTNEQAIRIYLWDQQNLEVPGLSNKERSAIAKKVAKNKEMVSFANKVKRSLQLDKNAYIAPKETWAIGSIKGDMYDAVNSVHREQALAEWQENVDILLNDPAQMAKLEAGLGTVYVEALKDMLYRMRTGKHRPSGNNKLTNTALNWLQGSVGAIMFFNVRSAVLQLISTVNYINHTDNNLFAFGKAILNTKQFAKDFKMIFNSPQLRVRRSGLQQDIQTADLADSLSRGGTAANVLAYLLKIGFIPTQVADSAAISLGGAIFYRNRLNTYLKEGMSQKDAEAQAMLDFQDITEEAQQSSRPDRISQQQASPVGRLLLAFQNTPLQYNRLIKKSVSDIANKRGDLRTNISRIVYYGTAQSLIFYTLQQALFVKDDIEEEEVPNSIKREYNARVKAGTINKYIYPDVTFYYEEKKEQMKLESMLNSMSDSWLRGSGIKGALLSTAKNVVRSFMKESEKGYRADYFNTFVELMNVSPQVGSKARKVKRALDTYKFNSEVMSDMSAFDIDNPAYPMFTSVVEGLTNAPLHRLYTKADNLKEAFNKENTAMQRIMVALGWNQWSVGIDTYKDVREAKTEAYEQEQLTAEKKYKADQKRELEEYKKGKRTLKSITCRAATASGARCKRKPVKFGKCSIHVK